METITYLSGKKASQLLGIHKRTLYNWERNGKITAIRTPGGQRKYNIKEFMKNNEKYKK
jgi:excisionase family DNA binding protein